MDLGVFVTKTERTSESETDCAPSGRKRANQSLVIVIFEMLRQIFIRFEIIQGMPWNLLGQ